MTEQEPTYEEYRQATKFARFRYKYGLFVMILCWLALLFIIYYMVSNGEAIASHPLIYGADKFNVTCACSNAEGATVYINGTSMWTSKDWFGEDINLSQFNITLEE